MCETSSSTSFSIVAVFGDDVRLRRKVRKASTGKSELYVSEVRCSVLSLGAR